MEFGASLLLRDTGRGGTGPSKGETGGTVSTPTCKGGHMSIQSLARWVWPIGRSDWASVPCNVPSQRKPLA